jgi:hypothetical protein
VIANYHKVRTLSRIKIVFLSRLTLTFSSDSKHPQQPTENMAPLSHFAVAALAATFVAAAPLPTQSSVSIALRPRDLFQDLFHDVFIQPFVKTLPEPDWKNPMEHAFELERERKEGGNKGDD